MGSMTYGMSDVVSTKTKKVAVPNPEEVQLINF